MGLNGVDGSEGMLVRIGRLGLSKFDGCDAKCPDVCFV
jgi:hypothetical protein